MIDDFKTALIFLFFIWGYLMGSKERKKQEAYEKQFEKPPGYPQPGDPHYPKLPLDES